MLCRRIGSRRGRGCRGRWRSGGSWLSSIRVLVCTCRVQVARRAADRPVGSGVGTAVRRHGVTTSRTVNSLAARRVEGDGGEQKRGRANDPHTGSNNCGWCVCPTKLALSGLRRELRCFIISVAAYQWGRRGRSTPYAQVPAIALTMITSITGRPLPSSASNGPGHAPTSAQPSPKTVPPAQ